MERDDNQQDERLIELGTISGDTRGSAGMLWEAVGMRRETGIDPD